VSPPVDDKNVYFGGHIENLLSEFAFTCGQLVCRYAAEEQMDALKFAWRVVKHVKSNAITVATKGRLLGMGSGGAVHVECSLPIACKRLVATLEPVQ
jgi:AICAR transformylase/IMP cyclohydrolase PurH